MNILKWAEKAGHRWANETIEALKCGKCGLILIGAPDCHIAFNDANDLKKRVPYNLNKPFKCPSCKMAYPNTDFANATDEELLKSEWKWFV
jgi:hypothetical protein